MNLPSPGRKPRVEAQRGSRLNTALKLIAMAALSTLLNAARPLVVDDTATWYYAAHVASKPLDPYGFKIFWYEEPEPANEVLFPLLVPYWLAVPIRLFGERPFLWKLWLFPFALLFATSFHSLAGRFVGRFQLPLVAFTLFSPVFLPSFNLMLDIPALALNLTAVTLFMRACDRGSLALTVGAGLVAGLAMQTKYSAFTAPAAMLLYGLMYGRPLFGVIAGMAAGTLFSAWEFFVYLRYGQSHFLFHLMDTQNTHSPKYTLILPLFGLLGGVGAGLGLLHAVALGQSLRRLSLAGGVILLGYLSVAYIPEPYVGFSWRLGDFAERFTWAAGFYGVFGAAVLVMTFLSAARLCRVGRQGWWHRQVLQRRSKDFFLGLWLLLEFLGYFALSPWPAVRRIFGIVIVSTLVGGRLTSRTSRGPIRTWSMRGVVAANLFLGALFYGVDLLDSNAEKDAVNQAAALVAADSPCEVWYVGHWGFQYYAEQAGMLPVVPGQSPLAKGDFLVVPDRRIDQQKLAIDPDAMVLVQRIEVEDRVPLRTIAAFYGGYTPMDHNEGPRLTVRIYRMMRACTPQPPVEPEVRGD